MAIPPIRGDGSFRSPEELKITKKVPFLLPADHPFVEHTAKMFSDVGEDIEEMRRVATCLYDSIIHALEMEFKRQRERTKRRMQENLRKILGKE
jgi:hypothetical protein